MFCITTKEAGCDQRQTTASVDFCPDFNGRPRGLSRNQFEDTLKDLAFINRVDGRTHAGLSGFYKASYQIEIVEEPSCHQLTNTPLKN